MEDIKQRIKDYVQTMKPDIVDDNYLDLMIDDVISRFIIYTNRFQLLDEEEDNYEEVIPTIIETTLAKVVVQVHKSVKSVVDSDTNRIRSMSDGQQSVSYGEGVQEFLSSASDAEVFASAKGLIIKFRMPTVVKSDENSTVF